MCPALQPTEPHSQPQHPVPASKPASSKAPSIKPSHNQVTTERYNILQKKVDDLEKVHLEGKKAVRSMSSLFLKFVPDILEFIAPSRA